MGKQALGVILKLISINKQQGYQYPNDFEQYHAHVMNRQHIDHRGYVFCLVFIQKVQKGDNGGFIICIWIAMTAGHCFINVLNTKWVFRGITFTCCTIVCV